jgi:aspartate carbamoyltransferase catalytic subunit
MTLSSAIFFWEFVPFMHDWWQKISPGIVVLQLLAFMIHFLQPKKLLDSFYKFVAFLMAVFIIILIKDYSSCDVCILIKIQKERQTNTFFTSCCKKWWKTLPPPKKPLNSLFSSTCLKPSPMPNLLIKIFYCLLIEEEKAWKHQFYDN